MGERVFWAIKGRHGFYTGTHLTRVQMIAVHVNGRYRFHETGDRPGMDTALDLEQSKDWKLCRKQGDAAVKVRLVEVGE